MICDYNATLYVASHSTISAGDDMMKVEILVDGKSYTLGIQTLVRLECIEKGSSINYAKN